MLYPAGVQTKPEPYRCLAQLHCTCYTCWYKGPCLHNTCFILPIYLSTHVATSSRRRKRDSKIRGLNNTSSLTMALLTSDEGVIDQGFYMRARLGDDIVIMGIFFLRGSSGRHFDNKMNININFTSAELSDD